MYVYAFSWDENKREWATEKKQMVREHCTEKRGSIVLDTKKILKDYNSRQ